MNSILKNLLNRPKIILTLLIMLIFIGFLSYFSLPKEGDPSIPIPIFHILIPFQGISPEDADKLLIEPMENELRSIKGLKTIKSSALQDSALIILEFDISFNKEKASIEIHKKINSGKVKLPLGANKPIISEFNTAFEPVINVTISGDIPERTLKKYAYKIKNTLENIDAVLKTNIYGVRKEIIEITINALKLKNFNITINQLITIIKHNNQLMAIGELQSNSGNFSIKLPGLFKKIEDILNLPIIFDKNIIVTLKDVASVKKTFKDTVNYIRVNGKPAVLISVIKHLGVNLITTNEEIRTIITELTKNWNKSIEINYVLDSSKFIYEVINSLQNSIITAIFLVVIVIMIVISFRSSILIGLSIPISFLIGFIVIHIMNITLNMMVMFGLVLTIGILVDGAIVIVEFAHKKITKGLSKKDAYVLSAQYMFKPILSSTATTLAAFLPLLLWPGITGKFMSFLSITVIIILSVSLFTVIIFIPTIGSIFSELSIFNILKQKIIFLNKINFIFKKIIYLFYKKYINFLNIIIYHPIKVIITTILIIFIIFVNFIYNNSGVEFFVKTEPDTILIYINARGNLSSLEKLEIAKKIENIIINIQGIKSFFTSINNKDKLNLDKNSRPIDEIANITIELKDFDQRRKGEIILKEIIDKTKFFSGIKIEIRAKEQGPPSGKAISIEILGDNYFNVNKSTKILRNYINTISNLKNIEDTSSSPGIEWVFNVDRIKASNFGIDILSIGNMIKLITNGIIIGTYYSSNMASEIDILLRLPKNERNLDSLDLLHINTLFGFVPINNFLARSPQQIIDVINRQNGSIIMKLQSDVLDNLLIIETINKIKKWINEQIWENDIVIKVGGVDKKQIESGKFLVFAMLLSIFIMFIILLIQFNSFYQTFITLLVVIMSIFGVLLGISITNQTFSIIMTGTGIVALAGIVVNNSIMLINSYNYMLSLKYDNITAILNASSQRFRPILLTTVTTIVGLLPMAMQININYTEGSFFIGGITSVWWVQLATAIIFGLGFSTILTLILIPVLLIMPTIYKKIYEIKFK